MKKTLFALIPLAAFAAGCSDSPQPPPDDNSQRHEIGFYATAPKGTRAAATTTSSLQNFIVFAYTDDAVIMDGVTVSRNGGSWTYSPAVYWPGMPVDFYAISPDIRAQGKLPSDGYNKINDMEYGSTDLLYAVTLDQMESPAPVPLTFRHAMSRVSVLLSSSSDRYSIEVRHVMLNGISLSGDFTLPEHNTTGATGATGTWSALSTPASALTYYDIDGGSTMLTVTPRDLTEGNLNASFFVPQPLQPAGYTATAGFTGSYMQIDCVVRDKTTGQKIWPNEHTPQYLLVDQTECSRMVFPLSTDSVTSWQQGYSYIYNVVINGAYSIDTIDFSPTVEDYVVTQPF